MGISQHRFEHFDLLVLEKVIGALGNVDLSLVFLFVELGMLTSFFFLPLLSNTNRTLSR